MPAPKKPLPAGTVVQSTAMETTVERRYKIVPAIEVSTTDVTLTASGFKIVDELYRDWTDRKVEVYGQPLKADGTPDKRRQADWFRLYNSDELLTEALIWASESDEGVTQ